MIIFRRTILCLALLQLLLATGTSAQTNQSPPKPGTGSISGRVTVGGKPRAGITVSIELADPNYGGERRAVATAETDEEGNYSLRGIKAGNYRVAAIAPETVPQVEPFGPAGMVLIGEGETLDGINITLAKGGVITGAVVDSNGWPVTGQSVKLDKFDPRGVARPFYVMSGRSHAVTDDRGVYRLYRLPAGKYLVSVGDAGGGQVWTGSGPAPYLRAYHPDASEQSNATPVEVSADSEATAIDIKLSARTKAYSVSGRVIDADTKQGLPGVEVAYIAYAGSSSASHIDRPSSANGEFRIERVPVGRYSFVIGPEGGDGEFYSDPAAVEVSDGDVTGIEIVARRGASISGVVVVEGTRDANLLSRISQIQVGVQLRRDRSNAGTPFARRSRARDGRFRIGGLQPGTFSLHLYQGADLATLKHTRTERDGVIQTGGIDVGTGDQVTGVRVVLTYAPGSIQGQVIDADMSASNATVFFIVARPLDAHAGLAGTSQADARGSFLIQHLVPGSYELTVRSFTRSTQPTLESAYVTRTLATQSVTVINEQPTRVTIKINAERGK